MHAKDKLAVIINQVTELLDSEEAAASKIPVTEWEERYKKLKGMRAFFGAPWNELETMIRGTAYPEEWIWESRKDEAFKKYYMLRHKADEMEVLVK